MPGVQMPHWAPPYSRNACWTALSLSPLATPSMVVIDAPSTCSTGTRQEFTSSPSISTEQAPHSPSPQPSFTPVRRRSSRKTSSRRDIGGASMRCSMPLTLTRMFHGIFIEGCFRQRMALPHQALHHQLWHQRDLVERYASRVFDGVEN